MFGYPPFTRDQRIGTTLAVAGALVVFTANRYVAAGAWYTHWPQGFGLLLSAAGVYFNQRRRKAKGLS